MYTGGSSVEYDLGEEMPVDPWEPPSLSQPFFSPLEGRVGGSMGCSHGVSFTKYPSWKNGISLQARQKYHLPHGLSAFMVYLRHLWFHLCFRLLFPSTITGCFVYMIRSLVPGAFTPMPESIEVRVPSFGALDMSGWSASGGICR